MLEIIVPERETFDSAKNEFITIKEQKLTLEHSLLSISKWESKWCKPFLSSEKSDIEVIDYIRCMNTNSRVDDNVFFCLTAENVTAVNNYINSPMTATTFRGTNTRGNREIITNELIYYWMIAYGIPKDCEKWHINRLLTLIHVCSIKNNPSKKMSKSEMIAERRRLNAARREAMHTKG